MSRLKVVHTKPASALNSPWLAPILNQYLEFEPWDPNRTYSKKTLFYINCLDLPQYNNVLPRTIEPLVDQGFKVFIDNLWEVDPGPMPNILRVCCPEWFWINESLWYQWLGYDQYQPQYKPEYLALMPMNKARPDRTRFLSVLGSLTDKMIWSYVEQGRQLPNDGDMTNSNTQRYFNAEWYDKTYINMVVESRSSPGSRYTPIFITEKTCKPLAFQQPFVVLGNQHTLKTLQSWGFETFNNLWDETYDNIFNQDKRTKAIVEILHHIKIQHHDAETLQKLRHNRDYFFNRDLVINKLVKQIIFPILEYAEL